MGRGGFGKGKYKKIIKSIYPPTPDGDVQVHNIGKLVHFCQISPTKLIKVAGYVEKKTNSDLTKSKLRFVGASMKIFQDLIKGCRKNLDLFSNNVLRLIKLLLECSFPKLKIIAAETFIQFTEVLDESTPYPELEGLISYLIDMCQNQFKDSRDKTRLKQDGLKSIRAYIYVLEMTDELDGFIARYSDEDNWAVLLPAILDNLSFPLGLSEADDANKSSVPINTHVTESANTLAISAQTSTPPNHTHNSSSFHVDGEDHPLTDAVEPQFASDVDRESVHALATEVLRDIFSRANISVTSMFKAILRYLEYRHRWVPNTFAVYIIQSIYDCLKVQHGQILITLLLQHAELPHHSITVKDQIFMTTIQFFTESTGYFMQILDSLIKHMVSSVEFTSQDQQVDNNAHMSFQDNMISCLGVLCSKISQQQKLDAFSALCSRLSQSKHVSSSGLSGVVVIFTRAILQVTLCTYNFPVDLLVPFLHLFQELSIHNNNDVRIFVQKIFQSVLLPGLVSNQQNTLLSLTLGEATNEQVANVVRRTIYFQIKMRMKHAENYVAIFETLRAMLFKGGKFDLVESFPLVFSIQKFATKWKKIPPIRAYTIHTLVAAYLYCVAHLFHCEALETYINTVIQDREKKAHVCTLVSLQNTAIPSLILSSTAEYSVVPQKKIAVEYVLFDRQVIVDMLCYEGGSTIASEKRLPKLLMKKFRNQSDTMTLKTESSSLTTLESSYFLPPSPISAVTPLVEDSADPHSSVTKSLVVLSPELPEALHDDFEKISKIDFMSMKRALVGIPFLQTAKKHTVTYPSIITDCYQKILHSKQISSFIDSTTIENPSWSIFDLQL